jgi:hypothetical protein
VLLLLTVLINWLTQSLPATAPTLEANPGPMAYIGFGFGWVFYVLQQILQALNLQSYLENFAQGVLDLRDFVLYASLIAVTLFFSVRGLTSSRAA